jgi:asparagine synthase (glutamine-hydrolysing)
VCGIAGSLTWEAADSVEPIRVAKMLDLMDHRGPDHRKCLRANRNLCWGSVRLAIVDPVRANQPLHDTSGNLQLLFNGEIYNYHELRSQLAKRGHRFLTRGDGEVILGLYKEDPEDFASCLDGMFAFALWDAASRKLVLGRDRCGIKPLFYWHDAGQFVFASELKGIASHPAVPLSVNHEAIADYLDCRFPFPPGSIFSAIDKVAPGTTITVTHDGIYPRVFWSARENIRRDPPDDSFDQILADSVTTTVRDADQVTVFLSGGMDSGAVAALAALNRVIHTVSVGYGHTGPEDERYPARTMARQLGLAHHHEVVLEDGSVPDIFQQTLWHLEEPIYTPTALSTFALASRAAQIGKVAVTGDGADELLLGYERFRVAGQHGRWEPRYWQALGWLTREQRARLATETLAAPARLSLVPLAGEDAADADPADLMRAFEFSFKLPEYHLTRVDRLAMAHGLEIRVPYLRNRMVDWALSMPTGKLLADEPKDPLRKVLAGLPAGVTVRPKQKFTAPAARWLSGPLRSLAQDLLEAGNGSEEMGLDPAGVRTFARSFARDPAAEAGAVWGIVVLLAWYELVFQRLEAARRGMPCR